MSEAPQTSANESKAEELQRAFAVFNQVSHELTQAYMALQARVESLTSELAVANGELRRQYQEKEALSERLSLLLNALPAGVVVLDSAARVGEANPAARQMFGDAVLGGEWSRVQAELIATEAPDEWLLGARRVSIAESPLDSAGGRLLLVHDITAAHALKANAERNQRLAAMGEMAASLAHQLRTPLATALLYSANLAQPDLSETARTRFAGKAAEHRVVAGHDGAAEKMPALIELVDRKRGARPGDDARCQASLPGGDERRPAVGAKSRRLTVAVANPARRRARCDPIDGETECRELPLDALARDHVGHMTADHAFGPALRKARALDELRDLGEKDRTPTDDAIAFELRPLQARIADVKNEQHGQTPPRRRVYAKRPQPR